MVRPEIPVVYGGEDVNFYTSLVTMSQKRFLIRLFYLDPKALTADFQ